MEFGMEEGNRMGLQYPNGTSLMIIPQYILTLNLSITKKTVITT